MAVTTEGRGQGAVKGTGAKYTVTDDDLGVACSVLRRPGTTEMYAGHL